MNVVLWILQIALAFLYFSGGAYKVFQFDELASQMLALSRSGWRALGMFEVLGAVLLIGLPFVRRWSSLTPLVATVLAVESLGLAALYARYSLELAATNPMVWALAMGLAAAVVASGRYAQRGRTR